MTTETIASKLATLPARPGCYLFRDDEGRVVYVGKASNLRARVRSYFQQRGTDTRAQLPLLLRVVADLDTIVTASEKEATILEDSLIKEHKPRFNIKLRDDKSYLSIRVDLSHEFPRLELVRRPSPDGARYFGPHHSATSARRTLHLIGKHFRLRTCTDTELRSRKRPCLQYHIQRCPGPCVFDIDRQAYQANLHAVLMLLEGRHDDVLEYVEACMRQASERLDFELAATYRDQLHALESVRETQRVVANRDIDQDVIGLHRDGDLCELSVLFVRRGRLVDRMSYPMRRVEVPDEEVVGGFIASYYGEAGVAGQSIPDEILVPAVPDVATGVSEWLAERRGKRVRLIHPRRGAGAKLLAMAMENAAHAFEQKRRAADDIDARLDDVQRRLRLAALPRVIECCDISHIGGSDTVGGLVRMVNGEIDKSGYRAFRVRSVAEGDDYGAIYEVLSRRFRRAQRATQAAEAHEGPEEIELEDGASQEVRSDWQAPDLLVVDGGRGQLGAAMRAARDLGLHDLSIVALAKERETVRGETLIDRVYLPGQKNGIAVRAHTPMALLLRVRDESHRFANRLRERAGTHRRMRSELEDVPGIGAVIRQRLLREIGGREAIRRTTDERLLAVRGVGLRHVKTLRQVFGTAEDGVGSEKELARETEKG